MNTSLSALLASLYDEGVTHDAAEPDRLRKRRLLEPASAELLSLVVRVARARRVVEIGTASGYSTLWLADAVGDTGGRVVSVDVNTSDAARETLRRASAVAPGIAERVEFRKEDGGGFLARLGDESIDVLFLDAERVEYAGWWPHPVRVVRAGGVLAIDNVLSHPDEVAPFLALLSGDAWIVGSTIAVGKGLHLAWRRDTPAREGGRVGNRDSRRAARPGCA